MPNPPKRPANQERHTPHYDAWLEKLRARLEPRGAKAELARFIATHAGASEQGTKSKITGYLARRTLANGQFVCAANAWLKLADAVKDS